MNFKMKNVTYDNVKKLIVVVMPALSTLVGTLGEIYGLSWAGLAVSTINAVTVFMGAVMLKSTADYNKELDEGE